VTTALVVDNGSRSAGLIVRLLDGAGWSVAVVPVADIPHQLPDSNAVILTGTDLPVWERVYAAEIELIRSCPVPLLGICGGHQLIGRAYGVDVEPVPAVIGRSRVRLDAGAALFAGLPSEVELLQRHTFGLTAVPAGFDLIATSDSCTVEGIRSRTRPMYGMQAHVEFRADGRRILRRFLAEADRHQPRSWRIEPHQGRSPGELAGQRASKGNGD
jgi:GMP synthase-like glutamine amidotransferase